MHKNTLSVTKKSTLSNAPFLHPTPTYFSTNDDDYDDDDNFYNNYLLTIPNKQKLCIFYKRFQSI